uniref:Uncharacterized protein n=1 Tax=Rhizophora mucronata TaxID=61149 RepID=A0A2P2JK53_RHIMU
MRSSPNWPEALKTNGRQEFLFTLLRDIPCDVILNGPRNSKSLTTTQENQLLATQKLRMAIQV